jgi:hypothetical protein
MSTCAPGYASGDIEFFERCYGLPFEGGNTASCFFNYVLLGGPYISIGMPHDYAQGQYYISALCLLSACRLVSARGVRGQ